MTENQTSIVKKLYESGKITFEEACQLSAECGAAETTKTDEPKYMNPVISEDVLVDKITNEFLETWEDEDGVEQPNFDYEKVLKYYKAENWKWFDTPNGIRLSDLKKTIRSLVKTVVKNIKEQIEDGEEFPCSNCSTGGLEVHGWLEDDGYEFELKFVPITGTIFLKKEEVE